MALNIERDIVQPMRAAIDAFPSRMADPVFGSFWDGLEPRDRQVILSGVFYRGEELLIAGCTLVPGAPLTPSLLRVLQRKRLIEFTFPPETFRPPDYSRFFRLLPSAWGEGGPPWAYLDTQGYREVGRVLRVMSFGAGVQSTTILHLMLDGVLPKADVLMFSDTGWEPPAVYEHLKECKALALAAGMGFREVTNGNLREDILRGVDTGGRFDNPPFFALNDKGKAGMLMRKCTRHYKARPLDREITKVRRQHRAAYGLLPCVEQVFGISTDEIQRVRVPPHDKAWLTYDYPLCETLKWSRSQCLEYLAGKGVSAPKSACIGCPYHSDGHWKEMRSSDPSSWEDALEVDALVRRGISGASQALYLHRECLPLDEALRKRELGKSEEEPDFGFNNECEGLCGL